MARANRKMPRNQGFGRRGAILGCRARGRGLYTAWTAMGWARKDKRESRAAPLADKGIQKNFGQRPFFQAYVRPSFGLCLKR